MKTFLKTISFIAFVLSLCCFATGFAYATTPQEDFHCPDGWIEKYESSASGVFISGKTVTFDSSVQFCVKAGTNNSGILTGTSYTVNFLNNGGQIPDISYVVIYSKSTMTPTSTPTITETIEFTSTPTVTETIELTFTPTATQSTATKNPTKTQISTLPVPEATSYILLPVTGVDTTNHSFLFCFGFIFFGLSIFLKGISK